MADKILTQARLKELFNFDAGVFTRSKSGKGFRAGSIAGSTNVYGYVQICIDCKDYLAHRLAWLYHHGNFPPDCLDHINRVRHDNRIENLRLATRAENQQNLSLRKDNKSGYSGVIWYKRYKSWQAYIRIAGRKTHLGYYPSLEDAISARKAAEAKYHPFKA